MPAMMPPLGLAAVPLPKKTLKIVPLAAAVTREVGIAEERAVALAGAAVTGAPLWRAASVTAAAGVKVTMRGVKLLSERRYRTAAPAPRLERPGEVALVDDLEALSEP